MNTTQAAQIAAIVSTCEHPDACVSECSNIAMAAGMCGSNLGCLCPTVLASGSGCLSCLQASHTNPTDAAYIASFLSTECQGITLGVNMSGMTSTAGPTTSVSSVQITTASMTVGPTSTVPPTSSGASPSSSVAVASSGAGRLGFVSFGQGNVLFIMFAFATGLFICLF
jgi:hypothetical protein